MTLRVLQGERNARRDELLERLDLLLDEINDRMAAGREHESLCLDFEAAADAVFVGEFDRAKAILTRTRT